MIQTRFKLFLTLFSVLFSIIGQGQNNFGTLSENTQVSVLTCTSGSELYSSFGHTAFRIFGEVDGENFDYVYNHGTFNAFEDNFYMKFARGKLNYILSKEKFPQFQYNYLIENRGVENQILNLNTAQKQKLYNLLEENYLPENRFYLYDFFYNNCATITRDILLEATNGELKFKDITDGKSTFRDLIQEYLGEQPWGDFGIDMALGLPCDKIVEFKEDMFLPEYLYKNLEAATLHGKPVVLKVEDLLLAEVSDNKDLGTTPLTLFSIICGILLILVTTLFLLGKAKLMRVTSLIIYTIIGFLGLFVFLLWFATDHTTTSKNLNLLWAMPLNILLVMLWKKRKFRKIYLAIYIVFLASVILLWNVLGQGFHPAILPFVILLIGVSSLNIVSLNRRSR